MRLRQHDVSSGRGPPERGTIPSRWERIALSSVEDGGKNGSVSSRWKKPSGTCGRGRGSGSPGFDRSDECDTLLAAKGIETRSATWNCSLPGAERLPGVGRTWSVHQPTRESPRPPRCRPRQTMTAEEIHPVGDTHGGLPWKTTMKISEFSPVRQESSCQGSTRIDCHNVSRKRWPSWRGNRSGL
jgi:hypothetical protein